MDFVIGGAIVLIGAMIVQAFVVPRVNRRTRAIDRWERDVLMLGGLLSDELSVARREAFNAWRSWRGHREVWWRYSPWTDDMQEVMESEDRKRSVSFREAWREYERLANVRLEWLAQRVSSRDKDLYFDLKATADRLGTLPVQLVTDDWTENELDEIDRWWTSEAEDRNDLQSNVERLAASIAAPTPIGPIGRLRRRWDRRKQRRAKKTMSEPRVDNAVPARGRHYRQDRNATTRVSL